MKAWRLTGDVLLKKKNIAESRLILNTAGRNGSWNSKKQSRFHKNLAGLVQSQHTEFQSTHSHLHFAIQRIHSLNSRKISLAIIRLTLLIVIYQFAYSLSCGSISFIDSSWLIQLIEWMNCVSNIASRLTFNVILIASSLSYLVGNFSIKDYLCWCVCQAVLFNLDCIIEIDLDSIGRQYQEKFSADAPSTLQRRWCNAHGSWLMAHGSWLMIV